MQQNFRVGVPDEIDTGRFEFGLQLDEVVDLSVVNENGTSYRMDHRLRTRRAPIKN